MVNLSPGSKLQKRFEIGAMQGLCKAHNTTQRRILVMTFFVAKNRKVPSSCSSLLKAAMSPGKYLKWKTDEENNMRCHGECSCDLVAELGPPTREKFHHFLQSKGFF